MKFATSILCILMLASCSKRSERVAQPLPKPIHVPAEARWFKSLRPGITRDEVHELGGPPTSQEGSCDYYEMPMGRLKLDYMESSLIDCTHLNPDNDTVSTNYYFTLGGVLLPEHIEARKKYLNQKKFAEQSGFEGPGIRTSWRRGICYQLDEGFIEIELILRFAGDIGFFSGKPALVKQVAKDGTETVLYRAADHWADLRPPNLSKAEAEKRTELLRALGIRAEDQLITEVLGHEDSVMGTGIVRRIYYLNDGLLVASWGLTIVRPGIDEVTFREWLDRSNEPPKNSTHSTPEHLRPP